jgi:LacI family transcriptional regulator
MKVTISDVAKLAGVSTATVSHTINNTRYVSSETKEKVYAAIRELGYTPDASARSFRTGKKKTVGFIVPDISNKFFATMIESVERSLSAQGYHLIVANTHENMDREETNIRLLSAGLVDGLLIASTMNDFERFDSLIPIGFPVVLVDRTFETKKYSSVCVSNFQPIYRSVCRLASKGDRRVGIIGGIPHLSTTKERISAYQQAVADCGLPNDPGLIRYGNSMENSACKCLDELLEQECDAVIVTNGLMAADTIVYLMQKNIELINNLDLVSFVDYDSSFYKLYAGRMDSIIQPVEDLGTTAGEQILRRIEEPDAPIFEQVLTSAYKPHDGSVSSWNHSDR